MSNRIFMPAHSYGFANDATGLNNFAAYIRRRLSAGVSLAIIGEAEVKINAMAIGTPSARIAGNVSSELYQRLADIAKETGGLIFEQLFHPGSQVWFEEQRPSFAPSIIPQQRSYLLPIELDQQTIHELIENFQEAALCAIRFGLDGVEIKADQGKLHHQFLSAEFNRRNDEYGGELLNRARFLFDTLEALRRTLPANKIIGVRLAGRVTPPSIEDGSANLINDISLAETIWIARELELRQLCDYISISGETNTTVWGYWHNHGDEDVPECTFKHISKELKENCTLPVLLSGRILELDKADELLNGNYCDAVGMARALIADAEIVMHYMQLQKGESTPKEYRPCIDCNISCVGRTWYGQSVACIYDPLSGREGDFSHKTASRHLRIAVIGAGPAGLEFTRCAQKFGASIEIFESNSKIGGKLNLWKLLPGKSRVGLAIEYWKRQIFNTPNISLNFNSEIKDISGLLNDFDFVVIAGGCCEALPAFVPKSKAILNFLYSEVLTQDIDWNGKRVVIVEGNRFGDPLGIALFLCDKGAEPLIVTPFTEIGVGLDPVSRASKMSRLIDYAVPMYSWSDIRPTGDGKVYLFDHCRNRVKLLSQINCIVWCLNGLPVSRFMDEQHPNVYRIGDAMWPRGLEVATKEAHDLAYLLLLKPT